MAELLTRAEILAADDIPSEIVPVPEWGGAVRVIGMTVKARGKYEASFRKEVRNRAGVVEVQQNTAGLLTVRERLVLLCTVDAENKQLFTAEDIPALSEKSAVAMERVVTAAKKLSGMSEEDIQELEKNSEETDGEGSSSVSQDS